MQRPGAALRRDDVVLVSFPSTDLSGQKLRPALVMTRRLGNRAPRDPFLHLEPGGRVPSRA